MKYDWIDYTSAYKETVDSWIDGAQLDGAIGDMPVFAYFSSRLFKTQ